MKFSFSVHSSLLFREYSQFDLQVPDQIEDMWIIESLFQSSISESTNEEMEGIENKGLTKKKTRMT